MTAITEQLGRVLAGRYRLDAGIGTGTSAHVYEAFDLRLGRRVAVKVLHPGLSGDERFLRRLEAEARAVAALSHPNVLALYDWGEDDDGPFLVLEHLGGGSLQDLLDQGALLDVPQAVAVGAQAARGLAYAHRRGFVHRDVKPANLLFDEEGHLRVADFGLARALSEAAWTEPVGSLTGSARYASPEIAEGRSPDDRADVYSLALVLYEAVVGRVPFAAGTTYATLMARVGALLPMAPELGPLGPILASAAIPEPLARLSASELADGLELLARQLPTPRRLPPPARQPGDAAGGTARPAGPGTGKARRDAPVDAPPPRLEEPGAGAGPPGRGRRRVAVLASVVLVCALLGAAAAVRYVVYGHSVPRLAGLPLPEATARVRSAGLRLVVDRRVWSSSAAAGTVLSESPSAGRLERSGAVVHVAVSLGHAPVGVPDVLGRPKAAALGALAAAHLRAAVSLAFEERVPAGDVVAADPKGGLAGYGSVVRLVVSKGPAPRTVPSDLAGQSWSTASAALSALRLVPVEQLVYSDTVPPGEVVSTDPAGGTSGVAVGSHVAVTVSRGPLTVAVPSVAGLSISTAVAKLEQAGLSVSEEVGPPFATYATTTYPGPGAQVRVGTSLTLYVA